MASVCPYKYHFHLSR
uniref:Uncharacterized protein n=1 Tax=Anguilla anguilla TaxID=7936 RepID=A0A0E9QRF2_ANGAN